MGKKKELNIEEIIRLYTQENYSANRLSKTFNVDVNTITNRLRSSGIEIKKHRKYLINSEYFESIDNEKKAYWLGFLMADGYNSGKFVRLDIQDSDHLEKLRDEIFINRDMPIRKKMSQTNKVVYYLTIQSEKIVSDLNKLGIVRNKSFLTEYPKIPQQFDKEFIRGLFDGDGCLTYSMDGKYRRYTFSIVGSHKLMNSVKEKLSLLNVHIGFRKTRSIYEIHIRGNKQIIKILEYLYTDSFIFLERKYQKYDDFITWDGTKRDNKLTKLLNT